MRASTTCVLTLVALALSGCTFGARVPVHPPASEEGGTPAATTPTAARQGIDPATEEATLELTDTPPSGPPVQVPADLLARMTADLAGRLGVAPERIELAQAEAVMWPDSSLGCPEPGMAYLQVITEGYQVILRAQGQEFDYRASQQGFFKLCQE